MFEDIRWFHRTGADGMLRVVLQMKVDGEWEDVPIIVESGDK